jgi:hypothetical protein
MKKVILLTAVLTLVSVWSCKDKFLEFSPPPNQFTDAVYFKTADHFNSFIIGAYTELLGALDFLEGAGYASQDVWDGGTQAPKVLNGWLLPTTGKYDEYWQRLFKIVSRANIILDKLEQAPATLSAADRTRIEGEAKFLRGFAYFHITRAWGDVPLLLSSYSPEQTNVKCTPEDQIWDQVILDLTAASEKLPRRAEWGDANYGRATKGSALGFLANAYMYKKDWAKAAKASEDLIALGDYKLAKDVRSVFTDELTAENTGEALFEVQFIERPGIDWSIWGYNYGSLVGAATAPAGVGNEYAPAGGWGGLVLDQDIKNSMDPLDDRRQLITREGEIIQLPKMTKPATVGTTFKVTQKNVDWSTKYWLGPSGELTGVNFPLLRYAEFLLNYAEILYEQGRTTEAYDQLNAVRNRAKLPDLPVSADKETFMTALMKERRWELNMEPNLWFHYTRTGRVAALRQEQGQPYDPKFNKFPIPQQPRDQNPNMCQNAGY